MDVEGNTYLNGSLMPTYDVCKSSCHCIDSTVSCNIIDCHQAPTAPGLTCEEFYIEGQCCPHYQCVSKIDDYEELHDFNDCLLDDVYYENNADVPTGNPCTKCVCKSREIICESEFCSTPKGKEDYTMLPPEPGTCCPTYSCLSE